MDKYNLGAVGSPVFKELYSGGTLNGANKTATLSDSINNYTFLIIECVLYNISTKESSNGQTNIVYVPDADIGNTNRFIYMTGNSNKTIRRILYGFVDDKTIKISLNEKAETGIENRISKIIGVVI